jgi:acetyltransferase-like isoleucine patch superfamily enzyme
MVDKIIWAIRGLLYAPFFGAYGLPSYIGKPIFISGFKKIFIGKKVRIYPGARIEVHSNKGSIIFNNDISIAQNFHVISGTKLVIESHVTISANVFITNIDHEYQEIGKHILKQPILIKKTYIGKNCFIGFGAVIQAGTILGEQCVVGANSVVRGDFPDHCVVVGAPAKIVKRYDSERKVWRKTNSLGHFL